MLEELFGETTGETDEFGLPVRHNWAAEYRGDAMVVYGHTPNRDFSVRWNEPFSIGIDTGATYGGPLTAIRLPDETSLQAS